MRLATLASATLTVAAMAAEETATFDEMNWLQTVLDPEEDGEVKNDAE